MKEIFIDELKQIQLDIIVRIDCFCRENGIKYFLDFGTGIGAVRHKGYIPWDDDIDIGMTRPNYEKFIHTFNGAEKHLYVCAPELDFNYYATYANVCDDRTVLYEGANGHNGQEIGVKVDIFPIDGTDDNYNICLRRHKLIRFLCQLMSRKRRDMSIVWETDKWKFFTCLLVRSLVFFISYQTLQKLVHQIATKYPFEISRHACDAVNPAYKHPVHCRREVYEEYIDIIFEGKKLLILKEYDTYLTELYGNYMQLPPENQRISHHGFTAYWKD